MNALQALVDSPIVERLGWILLHSIWQALAVAIGLAVVLPAVRKRGARASYAASCGALLLTVLLPALTFPFIPQTGIPQTGIPQTAAARVVRAEGVTFRDPGVSAEMPHAARRAPLFAGFLSDRPVPRAIGHRSASPFAAEFPLASPTIEAAPVELSFKERAASLGRQLKAQLAWSLPWLVLVWSCGVLALSLWNMGGWFAVQRLKSSGTQAISGAIEDAAACIARRLGVARPVRLLRSALVDTPLVIGAFKPVILLPATLVTQLPTDQIEALLAHELAHVLRHDYLINLLQSVVETLLFYHPAVWWISSQIRKERENCCDDVAVNIASDRAVYVRALATVAGARASSMVPAATGGLLIARLRRILGVADRQGARSSRWLTGAAILSLSAAAIAFISVGSRSATAQTKPSQNESAQSQRTAAPQSTKTKPAIEVTRPQSATKGSMRIQVVDTAGHPLPLAGILVSVWTQEKFRATRRYTCDSEGMVVVDLPKRLEILRLWAAKSGYCGGFHNFQTNAQVHELSIPDVYTFRLVKGTTIGGVVNNEDGQPIEGAKIECGDDDTLTDSQGRWKLDKIEPGGDVRIRVTHPGYVSDRRAGDLQKEQKVTTEMLRALNAAIILRRGIDLSGRVTDPTGLPVKRAVVIYGDDPYFDLDRRKVRTDDAGMYHFSSFAPGPIPLTVLAEGWMPESRVVEVAARMQPADFRLKPGKKLRIRFVDAGGSPVPGVSVTIEPFRGTTPFCRREVIGSMPGAADERGIFAWTWAPAASVDYDFSKRGFARGHASIAADGREHVQVINPVLRISGTVRDAATGRTIDDFLVVPVIHFRPGFPSLERMQARQEKTGRFSMPFDRSDVEHGLQIESPGYRTYRTSKRWRSGDADVNLDIRLEPGQRYKGSVVDEGGRPVKDARVYLASAIEQFSVSDLKEPGPAQFDFNSRVKTDENGRFEIASPLEQYALIVISSGGYGEILRAAGETPGQIRIHRWAKVTGRLVQSGKPVPNCEVMLSPIRISGGDAPHVFVNLQTSTRDDGSFVFELAPPVACQVGGWLHFSRPSPLTSSQWLPLRLAPGETARVTLGSPGIDVTGQLVAENQPSGFDYHFAINYLIARRPGIESPQSPAPKEFDWKKGWSDSWGKTQEGKAYLATLHHWFVKPNPDGHFRISGVEPGEYDFAVNLYGTTEGCLVHPIASRVVHISVNPGQPQLDLGKVSIPSIVLPKIGDLAADFEFTSLEGAKTSLAALRGKYVLLDFWATWCAPCVAKLDEVERLRKELEGDDRLVVVGVNLDADPASARKFLKARTLPWQHALLGDWSSTDVPRRYAISNVPAYVLIDPDGRILAQEYSLDAVASKLEALKQQPHQPPK